MTKRRCESRAPREKTFANFDLERLPAMPRYDCTVADGDA
jgi:hypothetical protein